MANPHRGGVALRSADRAFILCFSTNAMCEVENEAGETILAIAQDIRANGLTKLSRLRLLLWGALRDHHAEIGIGEAGSLLSQAGVGAINECVSRALTRAFPDPVKADPSARGAGSEIDWPDLLKGWVEAGQPADRFWRLTLREIAVILEGAAAARRHAHNELAWLAWHTAVLGRVKKMPKLDTLLEGGKQKARRQTPEEMEAVARSWLGGRPRRSRKEPNGQDHT